MRRWPSRNRQADDARSRPAAAALPGEREVLARAAGENFSVASLLLPRARARATCSRSTATPASSTRSATRSPGDRLAAARRLRGRAAAALRTPASVAVAIPCSSGSRRPSRALELPRAPFLALIEANRHDQVKTRYASYDELLAYCTLSANPVGELVLHVFGVATPGADRALRTPSARALQLAEHWQDVARGPRRRARLPARRGSRPLRRRRRATSAPRTPGARSRRCSPSRSSVRARSSTRARRSSGRCAGRARIAVAGYVGGGRAALEAIEAAGYDVLAGPAAGAGRRAACPHRPAYRRGA